MPLEKVLKLADKRMYHAKEEFKKKHSVKTLKKQNGANNRARVKYESSNPELIEGSGQE